MKYKSLDYQILMGEFPLTFPELYSYLSAGKESRLFEEEYLKAIDGEKDFILYVKSGKVACIIARPDMSNFRYMTMGEGTTFFFNQITPMTVFSQSWSLKALKNTVLVTFTKRQILDFSFQDRTFLSQYLEFTSRYHMILQKRTLLTASLTSSQRVLTWLYELCRCLGKKQGMVEIPCALSQQEIADILIIHISTCNKMFTYLKQKSVVEKERNFIRVDYPKLEQYVSGDWKVYG